MSDELSASPGQEAVRQLAQRYARFRNEIFGQYKDLFESLSSTQSPPVLFITCSDSRVVPELFLQSGPGDLFVCRNAGNVVPPYGEMTGGVSATIEFAVDVLRVQAIIVCGHSDCGAMKALMHPESISHLPTVQAWLRHAESARRIVSEEYVGSPQATVVNALTEENVVTQIEHLETHPCVRSAIRRRGLEIYGWVYHVPNGEIVTLDSARGGFVPLDEHVRPATQKTRRMVR